MSGPMTFETPAAHLHLARMMRKMRALKWTPGKSDRLYAKKHSLSLDHTRRYTAEAWKRCKAEVLDKDRVAVTVAQVVEQVMGDALLETRNPAMIERKGKDGEPYVFQESPNGARKVVLEAAKLLAFVAGAGAAERVELTGKDGGAIVTTTARDELLAKLQGIADRAAATGAAEGGDRKPDGS